VGLMAVLARDCSVKVKRLFANSSIIESGIPLISQLLNPRKLLLAQADRPKDRQLSE
jgi:hypothetical protein